mgnify:CR=1 FL=1
MSVTALKPLPPLPYDTAARLRELADDVEAGKVTAMAVGYVYEGCYEFLWPSSIIESMTITTLMQAAAIDRMRR